MDSSTCKHYYATTNKFRANCLHWPPHRAKRKTLSASKSISNLKNQDKFRQSCNPNHVIIIEQTSTQMKIRTTKQTKECNYVISMIFAPIIVSLLLLSMPSISSTQQHVNPSTNQDASFLTSQLDNPFEPNHNKQYFIEPEEITRFTIHDAKLPSTITTISQTTSTSNDIQLRRNFDLNLQSDLQSRESRSMNVQTMASNNATNNVPTMESTSSSNKPTNIAQAPSGDQPKYTYTDALINDKFNRVQQAHKPMVTRYQAHRPNSRPRPPIKFNHNTYHNNHNNRPRWGRNNVYKRVLLCDKTLISLDYLRRPRPLKVSHWEDEHYTINGQDNGSEWDSSGFDEFFEATAAMPLNATNAIERSASQQHKRHVHLPMIEHEAEPEWLLPDDDPLVLCDMWDLEKGLLNRKPPESLLAMAVKADFNTVREAIKRCRQLSEKALPIGNEYRDAVEISTEDMISMFSMKRGLIPGTKWCGLGDIAATYNDLGQKRRIDICCRAHDHCPVRLKPFRNDYGLFNIALYTKSHCECDTDFYRCLREIRSKTADMLGNLYFNVMKLQCLREEPMKMCRELR